MEARYARRTRQVLVRELDLEVLVYDLDSKDVHRLTGPTAAVYAAATECRSVDELATAAGTDGATALAALVQLQQLGLLADESRGLPRRSLLRVGLMAGATLAALPAVQTVSAPTALAASSIADEEHSRNPQSQPPGQRGDSRQRP